MKKSKLFITICSLTFVVFFTMEAHSASSNPVKNAVQNVSGAVNKAALNNVETAKIQTLDNSENEDGLDNKDILSNCDSAMCGMSNSFSAIIENILPTVVSITTSKNKSYSDEFYENNNDSLQSIGSGFIISDDGYIITNNHVVDGAEKINIRLKGSDIDFAAEVIGVDEVVDIALLKITLKNSKLPFAELDTTDSQKIGDFVFVAGNPYNLGISVSRGIISGLHRSLRISAFDNFIQTDASINKGNSGGPMFNTRGKVIGLTSATYSPEGENVGIGFAMPISDLIPIIEELKKYGYVRRGWIGISAENVQKEIFETLNSQFKRGAIITKIVKSSPADKSGLIVSDIVVSCNGKKIKNVRELTILINSTEIGSHVNLGILRSGKSLNIKVLVDELKENYKYDPEYESILSKSIEVFDMLLVPITKESKKKFNIQENSGMYVLKTKKDGFANKKGIKAGDIIVSVNQDSIVDGNTILENIRRAKLNKSKYVFLITSKGNLIFIPIREDKISNTNS